ncbi:hypothetical protein CC1G_12018 [Coprinopsis cinerea okayama7|uniref:DUF4211 domain-containing protein n=1 Tax=Coprinopsis cinerea (strain Okayama-7 / 130 / ATCC MYA-4618 / FGSC 9003) TaxID=240176 RepID=A8NF23_COPC7|nr:hypothetical protein CC1G_12018 [Coprinopsis cinerea okayama7\|eukprot:XP_001833193.1 hypothetical protein CC1G_12018 [Coprinopsis cinerea okayama7\
MKRRRSNATRQTTLFEFSDARRASTTPSLASQSPRKKNLNTLDSSSDSEDIREIKLESAESSSSSSSSEDEKQEDDDEEASDQPLRTPRRTSVNRTTVKTESEGEDSDTLPLNIVQQRSARKAKRLAQTQSDDEEDSPPPKRRRLTRRRTIIVHENTDVDSAEEEDDLDSDCIIESRFRERRQTQYQKNLEKLKKRKQRKTASPSSDEDDDAENSESDGDSAPTLFKGAKPSNRNTSDEDDGDGGDGESDEGEDSESDWIVEDDPVAAPRLPAMFSMETHQDLAHQFKKVFQLFVHVAVHPSKKRKKEMERLLEDEYFRVPLKMVQRKLDGLRDSLVASSMWRPQFKKALQTYPEFVLTQLDFTIPGCDACHMGSRVATRRGALAGEPYNPIGFRELWKEKKSARKKKQKEKKKRQKKGKRSRSDSDSDSESESDEEEIKKQFDLGRFCAVRTQTFHEYCHWEYATFKAIEREIDDIRSSRENHSGGGFHRVAYMGGKEPPDDLTDADGICEWLDDRNVIEFEWSRIKGLMDRAHKLDADFKAGGGADRD